MGAGYDPAPMGACVYLKLGSGTGPTLRGDRRFAMQLYLARS
jgi:hypothetical protein